MNLDAQEPKVEQKGSVLPFPGVRPRLAKAGTSPNKGHEATGRTREYLTPAEIDQLLTAAKRTARNGHRNHMIVLMGYRHGLRVSEIADLRWADVDFQQGTILIRRLKGSHDSTHYLEGDELRGLRRLERENADSPFIFCSSTGAPLASSAISAMIKRTGKGLFRFPIHAHMLRHSCGYYLANKGVDTRTIQAWLGHANIRHTAHYTAMSPTQFKGLWS
ncbi:Type 1 fimbriae regulatory protein FimB [Halomicronema hongdechloris C2206]|uniref:Type 1 fimbriae regulatory protein FimB n=1 Tax=Halomicronema hongdechloris C2206 TaxID=1641165 RepID=A0A1Z3HJ14_9CYAN|nr:tyrosine-type recombinase/integrase [Halomicronema hongdechloris]ASC70291.1 Type 1 fimbriae regulatory protein FimB [Halomicronema hongdechloris C2206]